MQEIWKDIEDYEGLYQVSNLGKVKSLPKLVNRKNNSKYLTNEKILELEKQIENMKGMMLNAKSDTVDVNEPTTIKKSSKTEK